MAWYKFDNIESFNEWHEQFKQTHGYPIPSKDSTGKIIGSPYTTDYTEPVVVSGNDIRAFIEDKYSNGLTLSEKPVVDSENNYGNS